MDDDFLERVRDWIETSGRALEMRVARAFALASADTVELSFSYRDTVSQLLREGDVLASFGWSSANAVPSSIEVVVECKNSTKNAWVGFAREPTSRPFNLAEWAHFYHGPFVGIIEPLANRWEGLSPFVDTQLATHIVAAHGGDRNTANDAVRQAISAADGRKMRYIDRQVSEPRGVVIIPAVVTPAPLLSCRIDSGGKIALAEAPTIAVDGVRADGSRTRVMVVSETALAEFAQQMRTLAGRAGQVGAPE